MPNNAQPEAKLSKSKYMKGRQCAKALWFYTHMDDFKRAAGCGAPKNDNAHMATRIDIGFEVGELAKDYFAGGIEVVGDYRNPKGRSQETRDYVAAGHDVIYEAMALNLTDGSHASIDVLVKVPGTADEWDMVEVKAATGVKPYHVEDLSFQYHAFTGAGYKIRNCYLMHVNRAYVRDGAIDLKQLLKLHDITDRVTANQKRVETDTLEINKVLDLPAAPQADIGPRCNSPHECQFKSHCWKAVPLYSVFNAAAGVKEAAALVRRTGSYDVKDLPADFTPQGTRAIELAAYKAGTVHVDKKPLKEFIGKLKYPLYFLDYEWISPVVPPYDGIKPFESVPFQFSLHTRNGPGALLKHDSFIHKEATDPRKAFIKELIKLCGTKGSIVVYNKAAESQRNNELARDFPQYEKALRALNERMVDLAEPVEKRWVYSPGQNGATSLKAVIPCFSKLTYKGMAIPNGPAAAGAYQDFLRGEKDQAAQDKLWQDLTAYCGLDTLSMVELLDAFRGLANQPAPKPPASKPIDPAP